MELRTLQLHLDKQNKNYFILNTEAAPHVIHRSYIQEPLTQLRQTHIYTHTGAKLLKSKLNFVITGRQHKAPVTVSAASAVPPIYIALCIEIANKGTIGTICHSFIAVLLFFSLSATQTQTCHLHICMQDKQSYTLYISTPQGGVLIGKPVLKWKKIF